MQPNETNPPESTPTPSQPTPDPVVFQPTVITPTQTSGAVGDAAAHTQQSSATQAYASVPAQATAWSSGGDTPVSAAAPVKRKFPKTAIFGAAGVVLLALSGAGYYFGYYANSSLLYGQALKNSGKGVTELTDLLTDQKRTDVAGYIGNGTYKIDGADFTTDGKLSFKSDKKNSESSFDVGLGTSRLAVAARTIKSSGTSPDVFIKAKGLNGLESLVGSGIAQVTTKYDDKWIVVDHTLLDNLQKQSTSATTGMPPTSEQILDELKMFNQINQSYIFNNDKNSSVSKVLKTYGIEKEAGHKIIHYQVGLDKANTKKYIDAQYGSVKASKLYDWIKKNKYEAALIESQKSAIASVESIKSSDTFDMYIDMNSRLIYKLRFADDKNPASNFVNVGLDSVQNNQLPFFVTGSEATSKSTFDVRLTANTKTSELTFKMKVNSTSANKYSAASEFTFKPTNDTITVVAPTGAIQLADVFKDLGLSDPLTMLSRQQVKKNLD